MVCGLEVAQSGAGLVDSHTETQRREIREIRIAAAALG